MRRNPVRSETDAFMIVVVSAAVAVVAVVVGVFLAWWAGIAIALLACSVAVVEYLHAPDPDRKAALREAAGEGRRRSPRHGRQVLVVANEPLRGEELLEVLLGGGEAPPAVDVLAPVLTSPVHQAVSDIDEEREEARRRLARSLEWMREHGIRARGEVGDASVASSLEDRLRRFAADEVIVVSSPPPEQGRQERGELERLRSELDVPVLEVVLQGA